MNTMKKLYTLLLLCAIVATAQAQKAVTQMNVTLKDGTTATYQLAEIDSIWFQSNTEEPVPTDANEYAISIPTDFTENDVVRVMADGRQVAEICREYINTANVRLVMVYPMATDGRADLAHGWCADNGGSISWNAADNTCTYAPGNATRADVVYLKGTGFSTTAQGEAIATTQEADLITDKRGDENLKYRTVKIGTQYWMAQNLAATKYRNRLKIDFIKSTETQKWRNNTVGAYHILYDDLEFQQMYGCMYNGYALENTGGLAPEGWDVAELADFQQLKAYLGTESGLKMKSNDWNKVEGTDNNNLSGFTADGAGYYTVAGDGDMGFGADAWFWTRTPYTDPLTGQGYNTVRLNSATKNLTIYTESAHSPNIYGHSIRCIRR